MPHQLSSLSAVHKDKAVTSYSILTMVELVDELVALKKLDMVSVRHENSTTKFFARGSASCSTCVLSTPPGRRDATAGKQEPGFIQPLNHACTDGVSGESGKCGQFIIVTAVAVVRGDSPLAT